MIEGMRPLQARLRAIGNRKAAMGFVAAIVVGEMKHNIPHKTSQTSRTLHVVSVTETSALIEGNAVAKWLDEGTGLFGPRKHRIESPNGKVMRWAGGSSKALRLSGKPRKGKAGAGARFIYARSTKGMKKRPYVQRSIHSAGVKLGVQLGGQIVDAWNKAA